MTDPVSASALSLGAEGGGTLLSLFGGARSAEASANARQYQGMIALMNAQIAQQQADAAMKRGAAEVFNIGKAGAAKMGSIEAAQSASGIDMGSASSKAVRAGQAQLTRVEELTAMDEAKWRAHASEMEAYNQGLEAMGAMQGAAAARRGKGINALGTLLTGASGFASKWSKFKAQGTF